MLVSAKHQHESAFGIQISPLSWTSLPPPSASHPSRLLQSPVWGGIYGKSNMETYITICKIDGQWEFAIWLRKLKRALYQLRGVGWGGRWDFIAVWAFCSYGKQGLLFGVQGLLLFWSTGSRHAGFNSCSTRAQLWSHGLSCSTACGISRDQELNSCPLHWQAAS